MENNYCLVSYIHVQLNTTNVPDIIVYHGDLSAMVNGNVQEAKMRFTVREMHALGCIDARIQVLAGGSACMSVRLLGM